MAPWVGRVRAGRFEFDGSSHQLDLDHTDDDGSRSAIHGTVYDAPWTLDSADTTTAELHCDLVRHGWPFDGVARQRITLAADGAALRAVVESTGDPFPAAIGWHPWFLKPDRLSFTPTAMYRRDGIGLPPPNWSIPCPDHGTTRSSTPTRFRCTTTTGPSPRPSRSRPIATTGSCTTNPSTPRASNRNPAPRMR